jgi:hypothetical protein
VCAALRAAQNYTLVELLSVSSRCSREKYIYTQVDVFGVCHIPERSCHRAAKFALSLSIESSSSLNFAIKIAWGLRGEVSYRANVNFLSRHLQRLYWK